MIHSSRFDKLTAEIFRFSLTPTTNNKSKSLNLLIVEEPTRPKTRSVRIS
jgi:hypothetical protein